jgi:hypothetical protein
MRLDVAQTKTWTTLSQTQPFLSRHNSTMKCYEKVLGRKGRHPSIWFIT